MLNLPTGHLSRHDQSSKSLKVLLLGQTTQSKAVGPMHHPSQVGLQARKKI